LVAYIITEISHLYPKKYEIFSIFKCAVEFSAALEFTFSSQQENLLISQFYKYKTENYA